MFIFIKTFLTETTQNMSEIAFLIYISTFLSITARLFVHLCSVIFALGIIFTVYYQ